MRRTGAKAYSRPMAMEGKFHPAYTQRFQWTPEIRMLDKDERLPEATMEAQLRDAQRMGYHPNMQWPPMDPLNPTKEQLRVKNTAIGQNPMTDYVTPAHITGFRTIPPELIDWRSTMYGDLSEELPHYNTKIAFSTPDYTLAGLLYSDKETIAIADSVPTSVEKGSYSKLISPKIDAYMRWMQAREGLSNRLTWSRMLVGFFIFFVCYKWTQGAFRIIEMMRRESRQWYDGANAGTWKYGGLRQAGPSQSLMGGSLIPVLEW